MSFPSPDPFLKARKIELLSKAKRAKNAPSPYYEDLPNLYSAVEVSPDWPANMNTFTCNRKKARCGGIPQGKMPKSEFSQYIKAISKEYKKKKPTLLNKKARKQLWNEMKNQGVAGWRAGMEKIRQELLDEANKN